MRSKPVFVSSEGAVGGGGVGGGPGPPPHRQEVSTVQPQKVN
jgi:hypothetical protein